MELLRILLAAAFLSVASLTVIGGIALHDLRGIIKTTGNTVLLVKASAPMVR
jgi:hypothetical protein